MQVISDALLVELLNDAMYRWQMNRDRNVADVAEEVLNDADLPISKEKRSELLFRMTYALINYGK